MQQLSSWGEVVNIGSRNHHRMDQAGVLVHACVDFHAVGEAFCEAVRPLVALLGLVHLWITLLLLVLGRAGSSNQGGIHDRALAHRHPTFAEVGFDGLIDEVFCAAVDLLAKVVLLQQMPEGQDRRFIRNPIADQLNARKAAHGGSLDQGLFHRRVAEGIPMLQKMDPQQLLRRSLRLRGQGIGRPSAFLAGFGVMGLDQGDQRLPWHHQLHIREKLLPLGLLLVAPPRSTLGRGNGGGQLIVREAELLAAHQSSPGL